MSRRNSLFADRVFPISSRSLPASESDNDQAMNMSAGIYNRNFIEEDDSSWRNLPIQFFLINLLNDYSVTDETFFSISVAARNKIITPYITNK
jgi:hypothetical protein